MDVVVDGKMVLSNMLRIRQLQLKQLTHTKPRTSLAPALCPME